MRSMRVIELIVMLPKQINTIVTTIRSSYQCVNMVTRRYGVVKHHTRMMVEFNHHHRAMYSVVKGSVICR